MASRIVPLSNRILVRRLDAQTVSAGGVLLPDTAVSKMNEAKVLAVGKGRFDAEGNLVPMTVAPDDTVLLPEYGGNVVKVGEEELFLFREDDILAKVNDS